MKQLKTLFGFEMKKIAMRKSTWIILGIIILYFTMEQSIYYIEQAGLLGGGSSYSEDGEFNETLLDKMHRDIKNAKALSGRKLDDSLLKEWQDYLNSLNPDEMDEREKTYATDRYRMLTNIITIYTMASNTDFIDKGNNDLDLAAIEHMRENNFDLVYDSFKLSDKERTYWQAKEAKLQKPITLQYMGFYEAIATQEIDVCLIMGTFWIAIVISRIFAEEHSRKTDQLVLSSRFGRKHVYIAKIAAGITFTVLAVAIIILFNMIWDFIMFGADGFGASVIQGSGWYPQNLTYGEIVCIMLGIYFLIAILTAILTMFLSERFRNSVAAISIVVAIPFVSNIVIVPMKFRLLSQLWNYLPVNLISFSKGFFDLRLVSIGGLNLLSWQFAPILYVVMGIILLIAGKKIYCRYQAG